MLKYIVIVILLAISVALAGYADYYFEDWTFWWLILGLSGFLAMLIMFFILHWYCNPVVIEWRKWRKR